MGFSIVVSICENNDGIGKNDKLPWGRLKLIKNYFYNLTCKNECYKLNVCIFGRKTYQSFSEILRPLRNRINIVISKTNTWATPKELANRYFYVFNSFEKAIKLIKFLDNHIGNTFIMGGKKLFDEAIQHSEFQTLYLTIIKKEYHCDVFFPNYKDLNLNLIKKSETFEENDIKFEFNVLSKEKINSTKIKSV